MRRILAGALTTWFLLAGLVGLALAPAVSAADTGFAGTWVSTDTDGSTQALAIGRGSTPAVTYQDFYATSCADDGAPSAHFVATGRGTISGDWLGVEFRNGRCGRHAIGPFGLGFSYDSGNDTLTDDFGITWYRFP
jgi:hypothetical protein